MLGGGTERWKLGNGFSRPRPWVGTVERSSEEPGQSRLGGKEGSSQAEAFRGRPLHGMQGCPGPVLGLPPPSEGEHGPAGPCFLPFGKCRL